MTAAIRRNDRFEHRRLVGHSNAAFGELREQLFWREACVDGIITGGRAAADICDAHPIRGVLPHIARRGDGRRDQRDQVGRQVASDGENAARYVRTSTLNGRTNFM
jgi:hypothetical protein